MEIKCRTCSQPVGQDRLYADEGVFHDRESCLDAPLYEALVADGRNAQDWADIFEDEALDAYLSQVNG